MDVRGKTIVLVGRFDGLRQDEAQRRLEELGARVTGSVTSRTDLVFVDSLHYNEGRKLQEARRRSIPIFDDQALRDVLADEDVDHDGARAGALSDLADLRARLLKLEREQGITEDHRAATREVREKEGALLRHPHSHQAEINDYALSPCGRYLATGTLTGDGYGGTLQIWEVLTGRCVNVTGIEGGVGRPGYERSIQWSADSRRIGLAYNTDRIGVFDPFSPFLGSVTLAECLITDGATRPVAWALAPDGRRVFVNSGTPGEVGGCIVPLDSGELHWTTRDAPPAHPYLLAGRLREDLRTAQRDAHREVTLRADGWVRWSRDGTRLQAQGASRGHAEAFVVDVSSGQVSWLAGVGALAAWSPDDRLLVHVDEGLHFLDAVTGKPTGAGTGHSGVSALQWGMRGEVPRLAAMVAGSNASGARPGVLIYDEDRFRYRLDVTPVEEGMVYADSWAWAPSGDAGAWLTADGRVEVWSLEGDEPQRLRTVEVPPETGVLLWGADDVLVAMSPTTLRFLRAGSGETVGDFTCFHHPRVPKPLGDNYWFFERKHFAPDDGTWCAVFEEGVVIAPDGRGRESWDEVLAWTVDERLAWPVRWGELDVVPDARSAGRALGDAPDGQWLRDYWDSIR
ncbi:WD40 repeat domain-containing protein [Streptomyces angustmyceticus]|uniref:WD40 repeat domain-containing protein n=1 Tax=Streptomyces angustmyceticus TaxID=285578 RepID=UPI00344B3504